MALTWWQAIAAFFVDAIVLFGVSLVTKPKSEDELRGLVWGLKRREQESDELPGDRVWYRSIPVLAGGAIVLIVALNIIFI